MLYSCSATQTIYITQTKSHLNALHKAAMAVTLLVVVVVMAVALMRTIQKVHINNNQRPKLHIINRHVLFGEKKMLWAHCHSKAYHHHYQKPFIVDCVCVFIEF